MHWLVLLHTFNHTILWYGFTYMFSYNFTYVARNHLEAVFRDCLFGRSVTWPLQTHDLAPLDLFHPRSLICDTHMKTKRT
jgi:hypothetical protein